MQRSRQQTRSLQVLFNQRPCYTMISALSFILTKCNATFLRAQSEVGARSPEMDSNKSIPAPKRL